MQTEICSWFGPKTLDLNPGQLDSNARHAFTSGQCHAMALALQEHTGWTIGGLSWEYVPDIDAEMPNHVVVQAPSGDLLDVEGWGVEERWQDDFMPVDPEDVKSNYPEQGYLEPDMDAAREFAPLVLAEYAPEGW